MTTRDAVVATVLALGTAMLVACAPEPCEFRAPCDCQDGKPAIKVCGSMALHSGVKPYMLGDCYCNPDR